jgi:hypothetical protein
VCDAAYEADTSGAIPAAHAYRQPIVGLVSGEGGMVMAAGEQPTAEQRVHHRARIATGDVHTGTNLPVVVPLDGDSVRGIV